VIIETTKCREYIQMRIGSGKLKLTEEMKSKNINDGRPLEGKSRL
jgi:hypothetical protein